MTGVREESLRRVPPVGRPRDHDSAQLTAPLVHRGDIEGLRAVAVLLVLLLHAGLPVPGGYVGVDVFFVISGFLITSLLYDEFVRTRRVSLQGFYARRARRLLPAAATVLAATAVLTVLLLPRTRWRDIGFDTLASALYVENWRLASLSVDYQAQDNAVSPLQHFWSLAVEEQFYLVWPLVLVGVAALLSAGRLGRRVRGPLTSADPATQRRTVLVLLGVIVTVALASYAWSVWYTHQNQAQAYFVTTTRFWELAAGGVLAILATRVATLPARFAALLGWAGLVAVGVSAYAFDGSTAFPGAMAAVPVLGTVAILAAGLNTAARGPRVLLDTAPLRWVGRLSYSIYLWHWPLLVIAAARLGDLSAFEGTAVVALAFVPAYLSFRYVEDPIRRAPRFRRDAVRSLKLGAVATAASVAVASAVILTTPRPEPVVPLQVSLDDSGSADAPKRGAMVLADDPRDDPAGRPVKKVSTLYLDPIQAADDRGPGFCSTALMDVEIETCAGGDMSSDVEVALLGDSHAQQWTTPLYAVAEERGWRLDGYTKSACPFIEQEVGVALDAQGRASAARPYTQCSKWRAKVVERLSRKPPAMAIISSGDHVPMVDGELVGGQRGVELLRRGYQKAMKRFLAMGTEVVVIADTPTTNIPMPECVERNRDNLTKCTVPRSKANRADRSVLVAAAKALGPKVTLIDLSDAICPTKRCAPVIGGIIVWRDVGHLSASYAATLAPRLDDLIPDLAASN